MKRRQEQYRAIGAWLGIDLDVAQQRALFRFEEWLRDEAAAAGGIGPHETERLFDRHIADSLVFLKDLPSHVETAIDVGGGVGLPSIPMAVGRPDIEFTLVDRSRRRTDLAARAVRIVGLEHYTVQTRDVDEVNEQFDVVAFRASLKIPEACAVFARCSKPEGVGLVAVSRRFEVPYIPSPPNGITFAMSSEGDGILDSPSWLLRMRHI